MARGVERISHYRIVGRIGSGGMGEVWRAIDERLGRDVAIKVLGRRATPERAQRMMREAQAASALNHPSIVTVHDVGDHEGHPYLVMELVDGKRFTDLGKIDPTEALRLCALAADALGAAHERGILHRDVKSDNLMKLPDGRVKVLDFGLAKVGAGLLESLERSAVRTPVVSAVAETLDSSERTPVPPPDTGLATTIDSSTHPGLASPNARTPSSAELTRAGDIIGTPAYMSPEQARGEAPDDRSEVFSLAIVLYELMCGRRPFLADNVDAMLAVIQRAEFTPPSEIDPALARYDQLFAICLALDPAMRPGDMRMMARLLRAAAEPRRVRRGVWLIAGGLAVVAGVIGVAAFSRSADVPSVTAPAPGAEVAIAGAVQRLTFEAGCDEFPTITRDASRIVFDAVRGSDYVLEELDAKKHRRSLTSGPGWDIAPALSPDGTQIAFLRKQDGPYRAMVGDSQLKGPLRELTPGATRPTWTPDGKSVWAGNGTHVMRWDIATGKAARTIDAPEPYRILQALELADGTVVGLMFRPETDGSPSGIAAFDAAGKLRWLYEGEIDEVLSPAPGGAGVVVSLISEAGRQLAIVPLAGGKPVPIHATDVNARKGVAATPDWSTVVWSDCTEHIDIAAVQHDGSITRFVPLTQGSWSDGEPVAVPGTRQIVVVSDRSNATRPWLFDRDSTAPARLVADVDVTRLDVTRDGKTLIYSNDAGELWKTAIDGSGAPTNLATKPGLTAPMVGPDGTIFFEASDHVYSVPIAGGTPAAMFPGRAPAPSPAGKLVVYARGDVGKATLIVRELASGAEHPLAAELGAGDWSRIRFSEDGRRVIAMRGQNQLYVIDVATGKVVDSITESVRSFIGALLAGPHGEELLVSENWWRGNVWIAGH